MKQCGTNFLINYYHYGKYDYLTTRCNEMKVTVVGPFLPGTQNYEALELLHFCVKNSSKINFEFIGDASIDFKESLSFSNE